MQISLGKRRGFPDVGLWLTGAGGSRLLAVALAAVAALHLLSLPRTPLPFVDDAWFACRAYAVARTGSSYSTLDAGVSDWFQGSWTCIPWLGSWLQSWSVRALGPTLLAIRLPSFFFGLGLLAALYSIGRSVGGARVGLLAALLAALSQPFVVSAHLGRPDVIVAAFGFAAVALYFGDRASGLSPKSVLSGLAVGLAIEIHPNGIIYGPAILALYLVEHGRALLRVRRFWGFTLGLAAGLLFYVALHILPYPVTYFALNALVYGPTHTPPVLVPGPWVWLRSLGDMLGQLLLANNWWVPLLMGALVSLVRRRSPADRRLLTLFGAVMLSYAELVRHKHPFYAILALPAGHLLLALLLERMIQRISVAARRRGPGARLAVALRMGGILLLLAGAFRNMYAIGENPTPDYERTMSQVAASVPAGASVMGPQTYWFAVPDHVYLSWEQLVYYRRYRPGSDLADAFRALRPDVFIIDRAVEDFAVADDPSELTRYGRFLHLPKAQLDAFLAQQAELSATVETATFGYVRVYRIRW